MVAGVKWKYGRHSISSGLGFNLKNFHLKNGNYFHKESDGKISILPFSNNEEKGVSNLSVFSLQMPILYDIRLSRSGSFGIAAGPIVNFNVHGELSTNYHHGDTRHHITTVHIGQRPVTVDLMGVVRYSPFALYVRYSPMKVLKKSAALDFGSFSTGIMLFF